MTARRVAMASGAVALSLPSPAAAHLASTGLGPVYDGAWHLLLAPGQLAALGAAALFAGRRGPDAARRSVLLMPPVWLLAWWAGGGGATTLGAGAASFAMLGAGLLLAADPRLDGRLTPGAAALVAAGAGAGYDGALAPANAAGASTILFVVLALLASISLPARRGAAIVMLRVAGSWTAALGLLLIGWWVRGRAA